MNSRAENFGAGPYRLSRGDFFGAAFAGLGVFAACLILLGHNPLFFWNDDYQISILPVFADVARSWSEGHLPLLSPYSWICGNLAGEFQYGTFSIFVNALVVLIWKFPLTFPQQAAALSIAHLLALTTGSYLLARERRLSGPLSMMVAWVGALSGWIICWGATDWFGALGAFAWLPWAWWGLERSLDVRRGRWRFLWPAPFIYLLITGGFPYTVLMLALLTAWLALKSLGETGKVSALGPLVLGSLLGLGLSAPAWLALLDYIHGSAREAQSASQHLQWLVPPASLPGFILPNWTVKWADFSTRRQLRPALELACGLAAPALLLGGLVMCGRQFVRQIKWELGLLAVVLALSMLPSAGVFRWSFRWLPLLHLVVALCAAEAWQALGRAREREGTIPAGCRDEANSLRSPAAFAHHPGRLLVSPGVWSASLAVLVAVVMTLAHSGGSYAWPLTGIILAIALAWAALDLWAPRFRAFQLWAPAAFTWIVLLTTYLCIPANTGVPKFNLTDKLLTPAPLDLHRLYLSFYPPPELAYRVKSHPNPVGQVVRPGSTAMWAGVRLINGYSPIRAAGVARAFGSSIHGEFDRATADYFTGWQARPDGELAALGVDGIIIANELKLAPKPASEWARAYSSEEGSVYHRRGLPLARVRSAAGISSRPNEKFALASITRIEDSRQRVSADVAVPAGGPPALITFSRPYFRGYEAHLGAELLPVGSYRGFMPVVEVPAGQKGRLVLTYRPWWLVAGGIAADVSALVILFSVLASRRRPPI